MATTTSPRVGIVGFGEIAQYHARYLEAAGARVTAAVTRRETPAGIRRLASLDELLLEVDALTIAVPNYLHAPCCLRALEARRPVFVEKPLCLRLDELEAIVETAPAAAVPLHVGLRLRWNPALRALRDGVGRILTVRCAYRLGIDRLAAGKPWTRRRTESGGALFTLGVHALDLARWFAGSGSTPLQQIRVEVLGKEAGADFPLAVTVGGSLAGTVDLEAAADLRGATPFRLELYLEGHSGGRGDSGQKYLRAEEAAAADAEYEAMMSAFVRAVRDATWDTSAFAEHVQLHRDLIAAEELARPA